MKFLRKWKRKRRLKYIPVGLILEQLFETLKSFNDDIPIWPEISKRKHPKPKRNSIIIKITPQEPKVSSKILNQETYDAKYKLKQK